MAKVPKIPLRKLACLWMKKMGSFTSAPKYLNEDKADEDVSIPNPSSWNDLFFHCQTALQGWPPSIPRTIVKVGPQGNDRIRVMQWNILAQALAEGSDNFVKCPPDALTWQSRRWRLTAEMLALHPDVLCLQEVDHFRFFEQVFSSVGFTGIFCSKPDSPCLYVPGNNGADGCALFINTNRFDILDTKCRCLEIWGCQTNQVAILCKLRRQSDGAEFWVGTTHLKARDGAFLAALRREQGCDLLDFMKRTAGDTCPLLLAGDMNASPGEPLHAVLGSARLISAYCDLEPSYTSWTIREDGEHCSTLDYILFRQDAFHVERLLKLPSESDIGCNRVPSHQYPSDHFALMADLVLHNN